MPDDLRTSMASLFAELQTIPVEMGFRERPVVLRSYTVVGANPALQVPGTRTKQDTAITPTPTVVDPENLGNVQRQVEDGGVIEKADLVVKAIPRTYTESQLRDAQEWVVDGAAYRLLRLLRKPMSWTAWLRKAKS